MSEPSGRNKDGPDAPWEGGCPCGEVRYVYTGKPVLTLKCHCLDCQASSGTGHAAMLWGWADGFRLTAGEPRYYTSEGGSGKPTRRGSCASCSGPVNLEIDLIPHVVGIMASSLDEPERFTPEFEIWTKRAPSWDLLDPSLHQFEAGFDPDILLPRLRR